MQPTANPMTRNNLKPDISQLRDLPNDIITNGRQNWHQDNFIFSIFRLYAVREAGSYMYEVTPPFSVDGSSDSYI